MYDIKTDFFIPVMKIHEVADFLISLTKDDTVPWRTIPLRQVLEGKGRNVKHWLVSTDCAPTGRFISTGIALCILSP